MRPKRLALPTLALALIGALAVPAAADIALMNATCPGGFEVHVDEGGTAFVNGEPAETTVTSDSYYEVSLAGFTASVSVNPDGSVMVSYTAAGGGNGICQVAE